MSVPKKLFPSQTLPQLHLPAKSKVGGGNTSNHNFVDLTETDEENIVDNSKSSTKYDTDDTPNLLASSSQNSTGNTFLEPETSTLTTSKCNSPGIYRPLEMIQANSSNYPLQDLIQPVKVITHPRRRKSRRVKHIGKRKNPHESDNTSKKKSKYGAMATVKEGDGNNDKENQNLTDAHESSTKVRKKRKLQRLDNHSSSNCQNATPKSRKGLDRKVTKTTRPTTRTSTRSRTASRDNNREDPPQNQKTVFVQGSLPFFWECPKCRDVPISARAKHSVLYHGGLKPPTCKSHPIMKAHMQLCEKKYISAMEQISGDSTSDSNSVEEHIGGVSPNSNNDINNSGNETETDTSWDHEELNQESLLQCDKKSKQKQVQNTQKKSSKSSTDRRSKKGKKDGPAKKSRTISKPGPKRPKNNVTSTASQSSNDSAVARQRQNSVIGTVSIQKVNNGLVYPTKDKKLTATIDLMIMSQVNRCYYSLSQDDVPHTRQKKLPENYPGVSCKYCAVANQSSTNGGAAKNTAEKRSKQRQQHKKWWFFNSPKQLATGFAKIEQHLMKSCKSCPTTIRNDIITAKNMEEEERFKLRQKYTDKITRREYASVVFSRLGAKELK